MTRLLELLATQIRCMEVIKPPPKKLRKKALGSASKGVQREENRRNPGKENLPDQMTSKNNETKVQRSNLNQIRQGRTSQQGAGMLHREPVSSRQQDGAEQSSA